MKTIKLKSNGLGRYDDVSPFIISDNSIELKVELPNVNGEFYLVAENNGKIYKKLLAREKSIVLNDLSAGELNAEVKHYLQGVFIKSYTIEALILRELDGGLKGTPEITDLYSRIDELKSALSTIVARIEKNLFALLRFAFADYKDNVYLGGGTFEEFIKKFGFSLPEAIIKEIQGDS